MVEKKITNPAQWKEIRPNPYDQRVDMATVHKIDDLVVEWVRLYKLAYQYRCKSNQRGKRIKLEQEYCNAVNGYIDYLHKNMFWAQLSQ